MEEEKKARIMRAPAIVYVHYYCLCYRSRYRLHIALGRDLVKFVRSSAYNRKIYDQQRSKELTREVASYTPL